MDQFLDQNRFADARAAEQTDLAPLCVRSEKVYHLDPRFKDLRRRRLRNEIGRFAVNARPRNAFGKRIAAVDGFSENVEHPSQNGFPHGNGDPLVDRLGGLPDEKPFAFGKHDRPDRIFRRVSRNFGITHDPFRLDLQGGVYSR